MNAQRTLYARNAFAAASLALIGSLAAAPAQAQTSAASGAGPAVTGAEITPSTGDTDGVSAPTASTPLRQAEVRAAAVQAVRDGLIDAHLVEAVGARPPALRAGQEIL